MPTAYKPASVKSRAPRARVPNNEPVSAMVERRRLSGTLLTLSATGGAAQLSSLVPRGSLGEIKLQTHKGKISAVIEFLAKAADGVPSAQAFRFIAIDPADRQRLAQALEIMLQRGFGVERRPSLIALFLQLARRLTKAA